MNNGKPNGYDNLDNLLRRIHLNPFGNYQELSHRQRELLNAISQMIQNNERLCEEDIKGRISKDTDFRCCFWGLWNKRILVT